jgi:hypothetical protein
MLYPERVLEQIFANDVFSKQAIPLMWVLYEMLMVRQFYLFSIWDVDKREEGSLGIPLNRARSNDKKYLPIFSPAWPCARSPWTAPGRGGRDKVSPYHDCGQPWAGCAGMDEKQ